MIFGAGYGWDALALTQWLHSCQIHYWGDIDTHGFAILNELRGHFPHTQSFLMDREVLDAHMPLWGEEEKPLLSDLPRHTPAEQALYAALRDGRIRNRLRLAQEFIAMDWVTARLR